MGRVLKKIKACPRRSIPLMPTWLYLTTGGILANYMKIGVTRNWPATRAMRVTESWPVDLWGCRLPDVLAAEEAVKQRLIGFRAREAVYPTETFEIDIDLALSIIADVIGRPMERLAYDERHRGDRRDNDGLPRCTPTPPAIPLLLGQLRSATAGPSDSGREDGLDSSLRRTEQQGLLQQRQATETRGRQKDLVSCRSRSPARLVTPDSPPDTKRLTYAELGRLRGISRESAERLARRRKWPRVPGNDGVVRVDVPADWATLGAPDNPDDVRGRRVDPVPALRAAVEELREQGRVLRDQLQREIARADGEAIRADRAEAELRTVREDSLWARLRRRIR